jgi:hypothetical protein
VRFAIEPRGASLTQGDMSACQNLDDARGPVVRKRSTKGGKFKRISLDITVPANLTTAAQEHILQSIKDFEMSKNIVVQDLFLKSVPTNH